jgi:hypothetical protein
MEFNLDQRCDPLERLVQYHHMFTRSDSWHSQRLLPLSMSTSFFFDSNYRCSIACGHRHRILAHLRMCLLRLHSPLAALRNSTEQGEQNKNPDQRYTHVKEGLVIRPRMGCRLLFERIVRLERDRHCNVGGEDSNGAVVERSGLRYDSESKEDDRGEHVQSVILGMVRGGSVATWDW